MHLVITVAYPVGVKCALSKHLNSCGDRPALQRRAHHRAVSMPISAVSIVTVAASGIAGDRGSVVPEHSANKLGNLEVSAVDASWIMLSVMWRASGMRSCRVRGTDVQGGPLVRAQK